MDSLLNASRPSAEASVPDAAILTTSTKRSRLIRRTPRLAVIACILAALALNVAATWQRWGDIIIDSGRALDAPKQLAAGKTLYKDVRYWYGPLAPYTNAILYRIFGVKLSTLTTAGIVSAALLAWLVYRMVRLFAGRFAAAATGVAFLCVNSFGQYYQGNIFNFALPYTYSATYGMLLAVASVFFLLRHAMRGRQSDFLFSCLFLALTALCKLEVLFAAGVAHAVFLVGWLVARRLNRIIYLLGYVGALAVPACVYAFFYARTGSALWWDNLFLPGNVAANLYTLEHGGLANIVESSRELGVSCAGMAGCFGAVAIAVLAERRVRRDPTYDISMRVMAIGALALAGGLLCGGICYWLGPYVVFRSLPVLALLCLLVFVALCISGTRGRAAQVPWIVIYAFGLAAASRMVLRCGAEHYGFYLLVPGLMGFAVLWCRIVPRLFVAREDPQHDRTPQNPNDSRGDQLAGHLPDGRRTTSGYICGIAMLAATAWSHAVETQRSAELTYGQDEAVRVSTAQGTMICPAMYEGTADKAVEFLAGKPHDTKVVVMPEGCGITFLAGCTNPLGVFTFLPLDFSGAYDEAAMIRRLTDADPDFIVRVPRDVREYGAKAFGDDYGKAVLDWVQANYKSVKQLRSRTYLIVIYGKR